MRHIRYLQVQRSGQACRPCAHDDDPASPGRRLRLLPLAALGRLGRLLALEEGHHLRSGTAAASNLAHQLSQ